MDYDAVLAHVIALLQQEKRVAYRVLKRRSCTFSVRVNIRSPSDDRQKVKKSYIRGASWPLSGRLIPGDALDAGRADARRLLRPPHHAASHYPAGSHPHGLGPRRHAKQEYLAQRPDVIRQSSGHGGRP